MKWLVPLIIAAFLLLLLLCRVRVIVSYREEFVWKVKYLFITIPIRKKQKGKTKEKPKKSRLRFFLDHFDTLTEFLKKTFLDFPRKVKIDKLELSVTVHDNEPAQTALLYGEACAVIYPAAAALSAYKPAGKRKIQVKPDFYGESSIDFNCTVSMSAAALLRITVTKFCGLIKAMNQNKPAGSRKGCVTDERASD